jgi:hypothetical protein
MRKGDNSMPELKMLGVMLPDKIKQSLAKEAKEKGLSVSTYVRTLLIAHTQAQSKTKKEVL